MEEFQYHHHHHHHHHHGQDGRSENEQHQHATSLNGAENANNVVTSVRYQQQQQQYQQPTTTQSALSVPTSGTLGGVQQTGSFHSVSSLDSLAEMSKYFPDAQTPSLSPFRHQLEVGGQAQSTAISNTRSTTITNTVNAGPYIPVFGPTAAQQLPQPVRVPFMAQQQQQQQQRPIRPPGPSQLPQGIPSYPSQVEGLSVSQAVVNDVLVDLQSKVINETLQQYQDGPAGETFLEPLPPIYIQAPQPTIILRSDINRLRAELNKTVRPQVVYRHPADANQFQQHQFQQQQFQQQQFQQNTFQAPRFPAPPRQQVPPDCFREYGNAAFANSDEYKTTAANDEHRKETETRLYNQAESPMFNDDNINANVHSTLDLQGLSATSFDRYASPYQSSPFQPTFEEQQQGNEKTVSAASQRISNEELGKTDNMPIHQRQEITFDIDNCIIRCFEAHRQRLARRRAARQARRAKRHRLSGQQQHPDQQLYPVDRYQSFSTQQTFSTLESSEPTPQQQQSTLSSNYSDTIHDSVNTSSSVRTSERSYLPVGEYDYTNTVQSTVLPSDTPHYQSSDVVSTQINQIPFPSLSTLNINATSTSDIQSSPTDYHEFRPINGQELYTDSKGFEYSSYQAVPSANDLIQQPLLEQQQRQTPFEYSNQLPYAAFSSADATVPGDIQHLTSNFYHQQTPAQFIQSQEIHGQPSNIFGYTTESNQGQIPAYDYQNIEQQSFQYPYNVENIQQQTLNYDTIASTVYARPEADIQQIEQKQSFNYSGQLLNADDYYQQQPVSVPISQTQDVFGQPTGTYEYTKESYCSQEPVYDYQGTDQQSTQYSYSSADGQQIPQQGSYDYPTAVTSTYSPSQLDTNVNEQRQTYDYSQQAISSSNYYQQQSTSVPTSQLQETYTQPSGTFDYAAENTQSHVPSYDYQNMEQQPFQYPYNIENIEQQQQQQPSDYRSEDTGTYISPESNVQQTEQKQTYDYTSQALSSTEQYQQQPMSVPTSQVQGPYDLAAGSFEYATGSTESQAPTYDQQNTEHQSFQYPYTVENTEQPQPFDHRSENTGTYISPETNTQLTEQKQIYDYTSQALSSSDYFHQPPASVPISQVQGTYDQAAGTFEYSKDGYQHQEPLFDYQNTDQQSSHYSYNLEDTRQQLPQQQKASNYTSEATTAHSTSETDMQQSEKRHRTDYSNQTTSSIDHFPQKSVSIPISQIYDSQPLGRRLSGASIPTGTVEYTRKAYYSEEPSSDTYTKETSSKQHQQHEESESFSINDYLKRFESESYSQQAGGQIKSSDDYQSITTTTTTPHTVQPTVDIYQPTGTTQIYDLQNYTNESTESGTLHPAPPTSSTCEEDQQHLLQHTSVSEQIHEPIQQSEQRSDVEASIYDTYSSLPPPPPPPSASTARDIDLQHGSVTASTYDFPAPPTPNHHSYQMAQQRQNRSFASIIPSTDQPSIYSGQQPLQITSPTSSDNRSEDDIKEDEEIFDLRECIARCYAKYRESWNKEQQRQYEQQLNGSRPSTADRTIVGNQQIGQYQQMTTQQQKSPCNQQLIQQSNPFLSVHGGHQGQPGQHFGRDEIHCNDGWTQTASLDVTKQSNIAQHTYDQTPTSFDTKPYIPQLSTRDLSTDSRGQQTIEYSPPLITQTHHVIPTIPSSAPLSYNEGFKHEQQQQQQQKHMYNHTLPTPQRASFNNSDYQSNLYFPSQIISQPPKYENIPFDKHDDDDEQQQQQHRFRAHSEPASIQQDSLASNPPSQIMSSYIFDQQARRSNSIPMIHQQEQQSRLPSFRVLDHGRAYETEAAFQRHVPRIDPKTGLCLVPCPESQKYAHLPPHLRPELFCIELPPASSLPPVPSPPPPPPPPPPQQQQQQRQQQRWCVKCCCNPGQTLIKKIVYRQVEEEKHHEQESEYDYASVMDQMATKISVRYGNSIMEEGEPFVTGNYCEKLRIIDFPVYVSGKNDPKLTPLVPVH